MSANFDSLCDVKLFIGKNISLIFIDDESNMLFFLNLRNNVGIIGFPKSIGYHFNILSFNSVDYKIGLFDIVEEGCLLEFGDDAHAFLDFEIIVFWAFEINVKLIPIGQLPPLNLLWTGCTLFCNKLDIYFCP